MTCLLLRPSVPASRLIVRILVITCVSYKVMSLLQDITMSPSRCTVHSTCA